ncbi:MAG: phosphoenolpyruvate carboxykinase, partial [Alistipes sp.]|nr:phosphoenolpyruvate carboxykinase [Alistipes sp.]
MRDFRVEGCDVEPIFQARDGQIAQVEIDALSNPLEESINDMGCVKVAECGDEYLVSISYYNSDIIHYMLLSKDFSNIKLHMQWQDRAVGHSLNSLLRIAFAQAVIYNDGISIHGSTVVLDDEAFLFLGASGTGKSTHSTLWRQTFDGCELLNDDNPTIRLIEGGVKIYGTP